MILQAVATLLEDDTSAIVTLKSSGLDRPSQLDGKIYASYAARWVQMSTCNCMLYRFIFEACLSKSSPHGQV